jgi:hypothetical protein
VENILLEIIVVDVMVVLLENINNILVHHHVIHVHVVEQQEVHLHGLVINVIPCLHVLLVNIDKVQQPVEVVLLVVIQQVIIDLLVLIVQRGVIKVNLDNVHVTLVHLVKQVLVLVKDLVVVV